MIETDQDLQKADDNIIAPAISIIVPVHNGGDKFKKCLDSITSYRTSGIEVIIVADGNSDGSWRYSESLGMKTIMMPYTSGPARARNTGALNAGCDILFFIDADVTISPDTIDLVRAAFANDPDLSALFGSYDDEPYEKNMLSQYRNLLHHFVHQNSNKEATTFWTGCGAVRKDVFFSVGGFSETYTKPSIEDIEFGYRLKRGGYKIELHKDIIVKHLKYWDAPSILKTDFLCRALPWTQLLLKQDMFINDLNLKTSSRVSVALALLGFLSALLAVFSPWFLVLSLSSAGGLLVINRSFYHFLFNKKGSVFLVQAFFWHWIYFLQSGAAFLFGWIKHKVENG